MAEPNTFTVVVNENEDFQENFEQVAAAFGSFGVVDRVMLITAINVASSSYTVG